MISPPLLLVVIVQLLLELATGLALRSHGNEEFKEVQNQQNTELAASMALFKLTLDLIHKPQLGWISSLEEMQIDEVTHVTSYGNLSLRPVGSMDNATFPAWIFGSYHKSGCELVESIIHAFSGAGSVNWVGLNTEEHQVFLPQKFSNFYFEPNLSVVRLLPRYRLVHFVRDPANLIISAYRFHCKALERWLHVPVRRMAKTQRFREDLAILQNISKSIPEDHLPVLRHYAENVATGATLSSHYRSVPEEDGVLIEAYRSWPEVHLMSSNYAATVEDPDVLQVHMESILQDFDAAMQCMLSFLALSRPLNVTKAMTLLRPLDITRHPSNAGGGASHITSGRYDNSRLLKVLAGVEVVAQAQKAMAVKAVSRC